jgi:hypothetical protein
MPGARHGGQKSYSFTNHIFYVIRHLNAALLCDVPPNLNEIIGGLRGKNKP